MKEEELYSAEDVDYLAEMINIGAGNAATALSQLLHGDVELTLPFIKVISVKEIASYFPDDPALPVICVRMDLIGDIQGMLAFIVPDKQKKNLVDMIKAAAPEGPKKVRGVDSAIIQEIANILAGVFLTAVHDFTALNIYHTVPVLTIDMIQAALDESIAEQTKVNKDIILIKVEFSLKKRNVSVLITLIPSMNDIRKLFASMADARKRLSDKG